MGGKSTLLRQTCLAALLAHVGAWVPAESLRLSPVDALFVRMGGAQHHEFCPDDGGPQGASAPCPRDAAVHCWYGCVCA